MEGGGSYSVLLPQQQEEEEQEVETLSDQSRLVNVFLRLLLLQERLQVVVVETEEETFNNFNRHLLFISDFPQNTGERVEDHS